MSLARVRGHYLEVLARRASEATGALRPILEERLAAAQAAASHDAGQISRSVEAAPAAVPSRVSPLTALNDYIREATRGEPAVRSELKSARRFHAVRSRMAALDQMDLASGRGPDNAGPLNAHMLVLRSLGWMRDLSPEYLQRFLSQVDLLLWLEAPDGKTTRPARPKKA